MTTKKLMPTEHSAEEVVWHRATVTRIRREQMNGHRGAVVWFTGLSGAGKSTLAHEVEERLHRMKCRTFVFDGDNVRHGLCSDLDFSIESRSENVRRIGEMVKLFVESGVVALAAFISPLRKDRERVRQLVGEQDFIEIYVHCPIEICESRDTKGLYKRARAGEVREFTGISSPYEPPETPDLVLNTGSESLELSADKLVMLLQQRGVINPTGGKQA